MGGYSRHRHIGGNVDDIMSQICEEKKCDK